MKDIENIVEKYKARYIKYRIKYDNEYINSIDDINHREDTLKRYKGYQKDYPIHFDVMLNKIIDYIDTKNFENIHSTLVNGNGFKYYKQTIKEIYGINFGSTKKSSYSALDAYYKGEFDSYFKTKRLEEENQELIEKQRLEQEKLDEFNEYFSHPIWDISKIKEMNPRQLGTLRKVLLKEFSYSLNDKYLGVMNRKDFIETVKPSFRGSYTKGSTKKYTLDIETNNSYVSCFNIPKVIYDVLNLPINN